MRIAREVLQFNNLLKKVGRLQNSYLENQGSTDIPLLDTEVRKEVDRFLSRDIEFGDLSNEAMIYVSVSSVDAQKKDPFLYSNLPSLLELETWRPREAFLILAGVDPASIIMEWEYENFMGGKVDDPVIRHANWFSSPYDFYDYPVTDDESLTLSELNGMIKRAKETGTSHEEIVELLRRLESLQRLQNDKTSRFKTEVLALRGSMVGIIKRRWESCDHEIDQRRSPEFFVRWAEARGFEIEWAQWARGAEYIEVEPPVSSPPFFDADSEDYPELLHVAVRAWDHARCTSGGTPKQRISRYVEERYPGITDGAREAISLIANWQKTGGRPKGG